MLLVCGILRYAYKCIIMYFYSMYEFLGHCEGLSDIV